jgi:hypothetical protein
VRTATLVLCVLLLVVTGCTWSRTESGLFGRREPSLPTPTVFETNPNLPIAGETVWTSAEGQQVTSRIAVHAVRRAAGMTVLDWSITPLSAPDRETGDMLPPGFDLGLGRGNRGNGSSIVLIDASHQRAYRPLSHLDRTVYYRCLCTPLWATQASLHLGETRLLQVAYPPLPAAVRYVDVFASTLPVFSRVPVTEEGWVPKSTGPIDLARAPEPSHPLTASKIVQTSISKPPRTASVRVDEIVGGSGVTTMRWTLRSVTDQVEFYLVPLRAPLAAQVPRDIDVLTPSAPSGPLIAAPGQRPLAARWITGKYEGRSYLECLCSNFGPWALGLSEAGGVAQLVTVYPALPKGIRRVDVVLPGVSVFRQLPVSAAPDGATRLAPPVQAEVGTWTYDDAHPSQGWSSNEWPTAVPDPAQLHDYETSVEKITTLTS